MDDDLAKTLSMRNDSLIVGRIANTLPHMNDELFKDDVWAAIYTYFNRVREHNGTHLMTTEEMTRLRKMAENPYLVVGQMIEEMKEAQREGNDQGQGNPFI